MQINMKDKAVESLDFPKFFAGRIDKMEFIKLYNLTTIDNLFENFPDFPQSAPRLKRLELILSEGSDRWKGREDPFALISIPTAIDHLLLERIPLYPSFLALRNLKYLELKDSSFSHPDGNILLDLLEKNQLLETVKLDFKSEKLNIRPSLFSEKINLNNVSQLVVTSEIPGAVESLISKINPPNRGRLKITAPHKSNLNKIFSSMEDFLEQSPPDRMHFEGMRKVKFSGPNRTFVFRGPDGSISFKNFPLYLLEEVRSLSISKLSPLKLVPSHFPALEVLFIQEDQETLSHVLSLFLLHPELSPKLKTITFEGCDPPKDLFEELEKFAMRKKEANMPFSCVEIRKGRKRKSSNIS